MLSLIERLLGKIDVQTQERFNQLSSRQLEQLSQTMLEFKNISDLVDWLEQIRE
ncbi:MAG: DUF4351 domain-containing protein [Okeania sp. SIO2C2]|nr:DUF4351 domain-containing protein [Okeania sp. SIO2C2]